MINSIFFRRILAFIIDVPIYISPAFISASLLVKLDITVLNYISLTFIVILAPLTFVLSDVISKGRSLGKRMFELKILDKSTNEPASDKQKIIRNLFFIFYFVDGILLLVNEETIGDRVAGTIVVKN